MRARALSSLVVLVVVAVARPAFADETIEVTPYAAWRRPMTALAFPGPPSVRRRVLGAGVEFLDAPRLNRSGWLLRVGGAIEHQDDCPWSVACLSSNDHVEWGGHARAGWAWRLFQIEAGLFGYSATVANRSPSSEVTVLPEAVARIGTRTRFVALGFGSFTVANILAPLTYLQGELGFAEKWATTLTLGAHAGLIASPEVDRYGHLRFDLAMRYLVAKGTRVGLGFGLTHDDPTNQSRTRLGGELRFIFEWIRPD